MSFMHRGQALRPFPHQFHGMSPHDMSLHDKQTFSWFFWYHSFPNSNLLSSVYKKTYLSVNIPSIPWYVPPWYVQTWWTQIICFCWYYSLSNSNLLYSVNKKTLDQVGFCCSVVYLFSTRRKWKWGPRSWNFWYSVFLYSVFVLWSSEATEESDLALIMCGHLENIYNCMHRSHGYYP